MEKKAYLKNQTGQRIVGLFDLPKGRGQFPVVIICHGFKGYKEQRHLKTLAQQLAKNGIAAFRFDFTNEVGGSAGTIENIKFSQELIDLRSVIDFVSKQKFVNPTKLGLAGHSLGGQVILTYTPTDPRIKVLADLAGVTYRGAGDTNLEKGFRGKTDQIKQAGYFIVESRSKRKKYKIRFDFYTDLLKHDTLGQIKKINIPTLIIHGSEDSSVPLKHSQTAYKLLSQPKRMVIILGAPHTWKEPQHYKKINPIIVGWFKKYL